MKVVSIENIQNINLIKGEMKKKENTTEKKEKQKKILIKIN